LSGLAIGIPAAELDRRAEWGRAMTAYEGGFGFHS
jgi:hypothetical protein